MPKTTDSGTAIADALRAHGHRATSQRLMIKEALDRLDRHVTAEQLLTEVRGRLPGVSLPTIYSALEVLEDAGLVRRVAAGRGPALYDARGDEHHHAVCRRCGAVIDLEARSDLEPALRLAARGGFAPEAAEVVVHGLCEQCQSAGILRSRSGRKNR
jgi:Fur family ferric uptake transcriptional regulator